MFARFGWQIHFQWTTGSTIGFIAQQGRAARFRVRKGGHYEPVGFLE
jgi:hypothetical protein